MDERELRRVREQYGRGRPYRPGIGRGSREVYIPRQTYEARGVSRQIETEEDVEVGITATNDPMYILYAGLIPAGNYERLDAIVGDSAVRAAVLPYTIDRGEMYFLLGVGLDEHGNRQYQDFGGKKDRGESNLEAARREFNEESVGVLSNLNGIQTGIALIKYYYPYRPRKLISHFSIMMYYPDLSSRQRRDDVLSNFTEERSRCRRRVELELLELEWFTIPELSQVRIYHPTEVTLRYVILKQSTLNDLRRATINV
jgi:8-oxo-dGTP pyrophosphatase MutT (NUDIX family)